MSSDPEARLRELITNHTSSLVKYIERRTFAISGFPVQDAVGETWIVVWKNITKVPQGGELPWLLGVARNVVRNHQRSMQRRSHYEHKAKSQEFMSSVEDDVAAKSRVHDALLALDEADRETLLLHYWDGLDVAAIAQVLSVSTNAAAVKLSRAKKKFEVSMSSESSE